MVKDISESADINEIVEILSHLINKSINNSNDKRRECNE